VKWKKMKKWKEKKKNVILIYGHVIIPLVQLMSTQRVMCLQKVSHHLFCKVNGQF
jgi:hypothetical protein